MYQVISEEMINYFANLKDFNNLIGDQVERYRPDYKQMAFMRQKFFEQVGNDKLDFDKFYEFYKWFDSSLSLMLGQLVPASADFSDNIRTMIENHVLERPKYQQKFPFLQRKGGTDITSSFDGDMAADSSMLSSPEEFAQGTAFFANTAMTKRQIGSSNTSQNRPWKHFHAPEPVVVGGGIPKSILFDGTNEYLQASTHTVWNGLIGGAAGSAKAFSVSFWVNPQTLTNQARLFSFGDSGGNTREMRMYSTDGKIIAAAATSTWTRTTGNVLATGTWAHVVMTFAGGDTATPLIYINGAAAAASTSNSDDPAAITTTGLRIATRGGSLANYANVYMCDFAVWDKVLSATEVTEVYGGGKRVYLSGLAAAANLITWYKAQKIKRQQKNTAKLLFLLPTKCT